MILRVMLLTHKCELSNYVRLCSLLISCRSGNNAQEATESETLDEAALIEQRRKRREAIKAKYRGSATPLLVQALHLEDKSAPGSPAKTQLDGDSVQSTREGKPQVILKRVDTHIVIASPAVSTPATPKEPGSPAEFAITNDQDLANRNGDGPVHMEEDGPSAADYDPTVDMREDRRRDNQRHNEETSSAAYDETNTKLEQDVLLPKSAVPVQEKAKKSKDDFDMFADEDDDMFAEEPASKTTNDHGDKEEVSVAVPIPEAKTLDIGMLDNWDDPEGYYKVIFGELLNGRYHVQSNLGRGMFSGVVRAMDVTTKRIVAIKLIRNNETM